MNVRVLTEAEFFARESTWEALLASSAADAFFLRHRVLRAWWRHFGANRTLRVLEISSGGRIAGYAPLCISRESAHHLLPVRELAFLGREGLTGDYLDVIASRGEEREVLGSVLATALAWAGEWDLLRLSDLREGGPTPSLLPSLARARGLRVVPAKTQVCPFLPLPRDWDSFLAASSANLRSTLRRREKKLAARGARFEEVRGEGIAPALASLFALHAARWQTRGRTGNFVDPRVRALHHELAPVLDAEGALGFWTLSLEERTVAAIYGFHHRGVFHYFQAGFDPAFESEGVGTALMAFAIRRSIERGCREFDFLRGDEPYKRRWTSKARTTSSFVLAGDRPRAIAWRALSATAALAKAYAGARSSGAAGAAAVSSDRRASARARSTSCIASS